MYLSGLVFGLLLLDALNHQLEANPIGGSWSSASLESAPSDAVISSSEILQDDGPATRPLEDCVRDTSVVGNTSASQNCADGQQQLNEQLKAELHSQILLRLLMLGLFGLVSASLALVYSIKFCLCRRKRRKARRVVANVSASAFGGQPHGLFDQSAIVGECSCLQPGSILPGLCLSQWRQSGNQIALADQISLGPPCQVAYQASTSSLQPPAYADLFGRAGSSAPTDSTTTSSSSSSQRNLLVKLNLNKTQLLSADNLILLSQLIDVPIVVHEAHSDSQVSTIVEEEEPQEQRRGAILEEEGEEVAEEVASSGNSDETTITTTTMTTAQQAVAPSSV